MSVAAYRVFRLRDGSKKKYRRISDFAVTYGGVAILGGIDHATRCGLYFNRERAEQRITARVTLGMLDAQSEQLATGLFEALADSPEEAALHKAIHDSNGGADADPPG